MAPGLALLAALAAAGPFAPFSRAQDVRPGHAERLGTELKDLADRVTPSVVGVRAGRARTPGTGVIVTETGLVLTSAAVVPAGAGEVEITLPGGIRAKGVEVARDAASGGVVLALGDVGDFAIQPAPIGRSADIRPGHVVATFGNPYNTITRDGTVAMSLGVVSGIYPMPGDRSAGLAIETDAAVNPGSFGGPLVDHRGHVVGMVVPAYRNDRWLGLARPIDALTGVIESARRGGGGPAIVAALPQDEDRGLLGIYIYKDDDTPGGARIEKLEPQSVAAQAGIRAGDTVKRFDGAEVRSSKHLAERLATVKAGQKVKLGVEREIEGKGWFREFELTAAGTGKPFLGVYLEPQGGKLLVREVTADGPAAKAGLKAGDVLVEFADTEALNRFMADKKPNQKIELLVEREGWQKKVPVTLGSRPATTAAAAPTPPAPPTRPTPPSRPTPPTPPAPARARGYLGVYPEAADFGVRIARVLEGSPAERAGVRANDVIVEVNGKGVATLEAFSEAMGAFSVGDKVKLSVTRDGAARTIEVTLGARPQEPGAAPAPPRAPEPPRAPTPPVAKKPGYLGISVAEEDGKVRIIEIVEGSPAAGSKLAVGQWLDAVDGAPVKTIEDVAGKLRGRFAGDVVVMAIRDEAGNKAEVKITLAARE